jgi:integrase/recombinase XerD
MRAGMSRDYVKELRGDTQGEAIDIYNHIYMEDLRTTYLAKIPSLELAEAKRHIFFSHRVPGLQIS